MAYVSEAAGANSRLTVAANLEDLLLSDELAAEEILGLRK